MQMYLERQAIQLEQDISMALPSSPNQEKWPPVTSLLNSWRIPSEYIRAACRCLQWHLSLSLVFLKHFNLTTQRTTEIAMQFCSYVFIHFLVMKKFTVSRSAPPDWPVRSRFRSGVFSTPTMISLSLASFPLAPRKKGAVLWDKSPSTTK